MFGSNASTPAIPTELTPLVAPQQSLSKSALTVKNAVNTAKAEFDKLADPTNPPPAAPVQAARFSGLLKSLATAENLVSESLNHRKELIGALDKILATNREALAAEQAQYDELNTRKATIEAKKQEIELIILGGVASNIKEQSPGDRMSGSPVPEPERPQVEALTPPHVQNHDDIYGNSPGPRNGDDAGAAPIPQPIFQEGRTFPSAPGIEMLSDLASHYHAVPLNGSSKKRKIENTEDFPDLGGDDGIDADVAEILRKDSQA